LLRSKIELTVKSFGPASPTNGARRAEATGLGHIISVIIKPAGAAKPSATATLIRAGGLIDTGASDVCIDYRVAVALGLDEIDQQTVGVVGASVPATVYMGILEIPELGFSEIMPLFALKVRRPTHDVLLGRSLLEHFIVTFDGPSGLFHFSRPIVSYDTVEFDE